MQDSGRCALVHTSVQAAHADLMASCVLHLSLCCQAELTGVVVLALCAFTRKVPLHPRAKLAANCLAGMVLVQVC